MLVIGWYKVLLHILSARHKWEERFIFQLQNDHLSPMSHSWVFKNW